MCGGSVMNRYGVVEGVERTNWSVSQREAC